MTFIVNTKQSPHGLLVIVTDKELLDKKFKEGKLQLDLTVPFYQGEEMEESKVEKMLLGGYILHLTGKEIISLALKLELIQPDRVLVIQKIPHAQVMLEA